METPGHYPRLGWNIGFRGYMSGKEWIVSLWVTRTLERKPADGIRSCSVGGEVFRVGVPMKSFLSHGWLYSLPTTRMCTGVFTHMLMYRSVHIHVNIHTLTYRACIFARVSFLAPSPAHSHGWLSDTEPRSVLGCSQVRTLPPGPRECTSFIFKPPLPHASWPDDLG